MAKFLEFAGFSTWTLLGVLHDGSAHLAREGIIRSVMHCGRRTLPRVGPVVAIVATAGLLATPAPIHGQAVDRANGPVSPESLPRPSLRAFRAQGPITLDGLLDEPSWELADSTSGTLWLTQPEAGYPAPDRTVIRIVYDDEALYMGAVLYDPEPERAISAGLEQDFSPQASDIFGMAIDASLDKQSAYVFGANPAGAKWDAQSFNDGAAINSAWEGIYEVETSTFAEGWIMEMRIPLTTLRFPEGAGEQTWGLNFSRQVRRRNEYATWAAIPRQFMIFRMSEAGTLVGLPAFEPGRNLQIKPFFTGSNLEGQDYPDGAVQDYDVGLDAKWAVTPRLVLDLTALTDFSQVEVDEEQVNLTRFSLFFPEKRDFFLENDGIFTFADDATRTFRSGAGPRNFKLFHS
ncbi:MAG: carbohydrate binding family 9 domain-containing protein, partial [Gemmatimonadetes bacterium]|nr:carbohydrate binding family 9 domain-containing protein [Gemmatimonadota bacterium]